MSMSDDEVLVKLSETRDKLITNRLAVLMKPKPTYEIDGQVVKWTEYLRQLDASIKTITEELAKTDALYEEETIGIAGP